MGDTWHSKSFSHSCNFYRANHSAKIIGVGLNNFKSVVGNQPAETVQTVFLFATRNGSSAEYSAIMEKFGNSRNTISNDVRTGAFTQIIVVFTQIKVCTPDRLPVNRKLQGDVP